MNATPPATTGSQQGFTLIELLVAVGLLALLTVVLMNGFHLQMRYVDRHSVRLDRAARISSTYSFLLSRLADAQPTVAANLGGRGITFDGGPTAVKFVAPGPESAPVGGVYLFSLALVPGGLAAHWQLYEGTLPASSQIAGDVLLLDGVARASFAYFGALPDDDGPVWHDEWKNAAVLPAVIRLRLYFPEQVRSAFDLEVAPRLAMPAERATAEAARSGSL